MAEKVFADGSWLGFGQGKFDPWCVYYVSPQGKREPPKDVGYFQALLRFSTLYGAERIYRDFVQVYDWTTATLEPAVMQAISRLASGYLPHHQLKVDKVFSVLYMAMIAEERKANTRLGKRIKRLGVHMLLREGVEPNRAAELMKGMKWMEIDRLCRMRGF